MNILINISAKTANSKDFRFFKWPIALQIDSDDGFGSFLIKSETFINPDYSLTTVCEIVECEDHLVCTNWIIRFPKILSTTW